MRVSVIGGSTVDDETYEEARELGRLLARRGHTVVCGGYFGVMEGVCRGAKEEDEDACTVGVLSGDDTDEANEYVDVPVATNMGHARNALVVLNGEAVIAVDGAYGTLSEIAHALVLGRTVVGIDTHNVEGVESVETPQEAVERVEEAVEE
ncbi:MAG: TIGR00725 family protein [Halobacteriales archaeon]|nr:TIGR00725 family protein [Halobacteriales archaeon]